VRGLAVRGVATFKQHHDRFEWRAAVREVRSDRAHDSSLSTCPALALAAIMSHPVFAHFAANSTELATRLQAWTVWRPRRDRDQRIRKERDDPRRQTFAAACGRAVVAGSLDGRFPGPLAENNVVRYTGAVADRAHAGDPNSGLCGEMAFFWGWAGWDPLRLGGGWYFFYAGNGDFLRTAVRPGGFTTRRRPNLIEGAKLESLERIVSERGWRARIFGDSMFDLKGREPMDARFVHADGSEERVRFAGRLVTHVETVEGIQYELVHADDGEVVFVERGLVGGVATRVRAAQSLPTG